MTGRWLEYDSDWEQVVETSITKAAKAGNQQRELRFRRDLDEHYRGENSNPDFLKLPMIHRLYSLIDLALTQGDLHQELLGRRLLAVHRDANIRGFNDKLPTD